MSLAHSQGTGKDGEEGWALASSLRPEQFPRHLSHPSGFPDKWGPDSPRGSRSPKSILHPHGNAKSTEPSFLQRRPSTCKEPPRKAGHIHPRPWTSCSAPGRKENPHQENVLHRTWVSDAGMQGRPYGQLGMPHSEKPKEEAHPRRWNKTRKNEYYQKCDQEVAQRRCFDEIHARSGNVKFWTHLLDAGLVPGGQSEKLNTCPKRLTGLHLKSGLYAGKFKDVQHSQVILRAPSKHGKKSDMADRRLDNRRPFDTRVRDDMIRRNERCDKDLAQMSFDIMCPAHTMSCPQMGAEWMQR